MDYEQLHGGFTLPLAQSQFPIAKMIWELIMHTMFSESEWFLQSEAENGGKRLHRRANPHSIFSL